MLDWPGSLKMAHFMITSVTANSTDLNVNTLSHKGRLPNFLIIGAAKSGTTSLARYLKNHPDVFMSPREAPSYFAFANKPPANEGPTKEEIKRRVVWQLNEYRELFIEYGGQKAVGEKSSRYLMSPSAAQAIYETIPEVRLVAILRNPADRAYSHFLHNLRRVCEPLIDFRAALAAEPERKRCNWSVNYLYREHGHYAEQLKRYYDLFSPDHIQILLYDDLVDDAAAVMRKICIHLGISEAVELPVAERHNASDGVPKNTWLQQLLTQENLIKGTLRKMLPTKLQYPLWRLLYQRNLNPLPPSILLFGGCCWKSFATRYTNSNN
jgi:hypothetical protein